MQLFRRSRAERRQLPLRWVLVLPFLLQTTAIAGAISWLSYRSAERSTLALADRLSQEVTDRVVQHVDRYLDTSRLFLAHSKIAVETGSLDPANLAQLQAYFWRQVQIADGVSTVFYGSESGDFLQVEADDDPPTLAIRTAETAPDWQIYALDDRGQRRERLRSGPYDPRQRPWYRDALRADGELIWSDVYLFADPPVPGITPAVAVYDRAGEPLGVLAADLPLSAIEDFLAALPVGESGQVFALDRDGRLVAGVGEEPTFAALQSDRRPPPAARSQSATIRAATRALQAAFPDFTALQTPYRAPLEDPETGDRYFLQAVPLPGDSGPDWVVVTVIPEADFLAWIRANARTVLGSFLLGSALAALLGDATARLWIARPIWDLDAAAQGIARGQLQHRVLASPVRELDRLGRSFNSMASQLCETFEAWETTNRTLEAQIDQRTQALRRSEEKFSKAFRASPDPIVISTLKDGRFVDVNDSFLEMSGYGREDIVGRTSSEIQLWQQLENRDAFVRDLQTVGHSYNREVVLRVADREERVMRLSAEAIDLDGEPCVLWVANDITERKRVEAALREQERYLRLIVDSVPQQVFWKNTDLVFLGCNRHWAEAAGLADPADVKGKTDYDLLPTVAVAEQVRAVDREVIATGKTQRFQDRKARPGPEGDERWLDITKVPIQDENGRALGVLGVIDDITERKRSEAALAAEKEATERLLLNVLPQSIVQRLARSSGAIARSGVTELIADHCEDAAILFADLTGFTPLSARLSPIELVSLLNGIFSTFDRLAEKHGLEKIKTIGDAYMVAAGIPRPSDDRAQAVAEMALDMRQAIREFRDRSGDPLHLRIGIHTGPVVAGVIGLKKFTYDLWGDTVNVASRMESQGEPDRIQVTAAVYERLKQGYRFEARGQVNVKGRGPMNTYWLLDRACCPCPSPDRVGEDRVGKDRIGEDPVGEDRIGEDRIGEDPVGEDRD